MPLLHLTASYCILLIGRTCQGAAVLAQQPWTLTNCTVSNIKDSRAPTATEHAAASYNAARHCDAFAVFEFAALAKSADRADAAVMHHLHGPASLETGRNQDISTPN
jgi:hypothetical protein